MIKDTRAFGRVIGLSLLVVLFCLYSIPARADNIPEGAVKVRETVDKDGITHEYYECPLGTTVINDKCVAVTQIDCNESISMLREQVSGIQEALRRMDKSHKLTEQQLDEWKNLSEKTCKSSQNRLNSLVIDLTLGRFFKVFDDRLKVAGNEMKKLRGLLDNATDPKQRKQLKASIKLLGGKVANIYTAKVLIADQAERVNSIYSRVKDADGDANDREKALTQAYITIKNILNDPIVKEAWEASLEYGKELTLLARFADSYVESAYQITVQIASWKRINQADMNAKEYLNAVDKMKEKMEEIMEKIKKFEESECQ